MESGEPVDSPSCDDAACVRVLIVDDHAMFASSIALALRSEADLVVQGTAGTLAETRSRIATDPPDVLLLDQRLPDGSGVSELPALKQLAPQTRVVVMSAAAPDSALVSALENGASGFLSKSATVDDLVQAIRAAAAGEVLVSPALLARLLPRLRREQSGAVGALTPREVEVLGLLAHGLTNSGIADQLGISVNTVRNHMQNVLAKLGVHSKLEALAVAVREGIVDQDGPA
jgi:DNA-binding NarL/FixJ family response regulator